MGDESPGDPGGSDRSPTSPGAFVTIQDVDLRDLAARKRRQNLNQKSRSGIPVNVKIPSKKIRSRSNSCSRSRSRSGARERSVVDSLSSEIPLQNSFSGLPLAQPVRPDSQDSELALGQRSGLQDTLTQATPPVHLQTSPPTTAASTPQMTPSVASSERSRYEKSDPGPYTVHVQYDSESLGATLHPVSFGQFLQSHHREFPNVIDGSVKALGRNRVTVSFHSFQDANDFLDFQTLTNKKLKSFIPSFNVTRVGIVKGLPTEWSPEDIINNVKVPVGCGRVIKSRRLNFKKTNKQDGSFKWLPSETVVLSFDGQVLPPRVYACYNSFKVDLYTFPTIQCFRCCRFGHIKEKCRSSPRCFRCGGEHFGDSCEAESPYCVNCKGEGIHLATSKSCPEFLRQTNIKQSMAEGNISYSEADKLHPTVNKSFANVVSAPLPPKSNSYKKTVFRSPRPPPPPRFGYDRKAHMALSSENPLSSATGTALNNPLASENTLSIVLKLLSAVSKVFSSSHAEVNLLSHVAPLLSTLISSLDHGPNNPPMEQQEH